MQQSLKSKKTSGILLHISSLPGPYGIGEIGPEAKLFIDDLEKMGPHYWQILPTNYPETCNSPYDTNSAFAQNPFLLSLDVLIEDGLITRMDLEPIPKFSVNRINFKKLKEWKYPILKQAAYDFLNKCNNVEIEIYHHFCKDNNYWLYHYSLFMVIKNIENKTYWSEWKDKYKELDKDAIRQIAQMKHDEIEEIKVLQYLFCKQWKDLKTYSNNKGIKLIGDIPIYISYSSADVWTHQNLFKLDHKGKMVYQSGCPPDHFMESGQLWGHPIYDWQKHLDTGFQWWINRIDHLMKFVDIIRIDHFNGFAKYWEVPAKAQDASGGKWVESRGEELLETIYKTDSQIALIAEDLGEAAADAAVIREKFDIPGMNVLQFSFADADPLSNIQKNTVLYTGTHDNDTAVGWYKTIHEHLSQMEIDNAKRILDLDRKDVNWSLIEYSLNSNAFTVIVPIQDLLGLGSDARMNTPGTISNENWSWRLHPNKLNSSIIEKMKQLTQKSNRV